MLDVKDECSIRHDRPTFVVRANSLPAGMAFAEFAKLKENVPLTFLRKRFDDIPHAATPQTYQYAAEMAARDFVVRTRVMDRYAETRRREASEEVHVPKGIPFQTERRTGAADEDPNDAVDPGLPQMD